LRASSTHFPSIKVFIRKISFTIPFTIEKNHLEENIRNAFKETLLVLFMSFYLHYSLDARIAAFRLWSRPACENWASVQKINFMWKHTKFIFHSTILYKKWLSSGILGKIKILRNIYGMSKYVMIHNINWIFNSYLNVAFTFHKYFGIFRNIIGMYFWILYIYLRNTNVSWAIAFFCRFLSLHRIGWKNI